AWRCSAPPATAYFAPPVGLPCTLPRDSARADPPFPPLIEPYDDDKQHAFNHLLQVGIQPHEVDAVTEGVYQHHPDKGSEDRSTGAEETGTSQHGGGNGVQFIAGSIVG